MADSTTRNLEEFARRLLACDAPSGRDQGALQSRDFRVCERLRVPLGRLMGAGGFRSLLSRAQAMAGAEVPWILGLKINADGSLQKHEEKVVPGAFSEGEVIFAARLLGLLITFIGPALTLRLVQDVWPKAKLEDLNLKKETTP